MPRKLVSDELWSQIEPLLQNITPRPKGGRPRIPDRAALTGIIFILKTGIPLGRPATGDGLRLWYDLLAQDFGTGRKLVFGRAFTMSSCKIYTIRKRSTGAEPVLTALSSRAKRGANTQDPTP